MKADPLEESVSAAMHNKMMFVTICLPIARMVHSGEIDPETVSYAELSAKLEALGNTFEDAFEIHITHLEEEMQLVAHCIEQGQAKSGVVLLFTLIEAEVNALIRILMRIRGFPPSAVTDALKGTSFDTKLDVLLPLLEVEVSARFRNTALQCKSIRNVVVHDKAAPALMSDKGNKDSDSQLANARSFDFFSQNPVSRIEADLKDFFEGSLQKEPPIQWSFQLFEKYFEVEENADEA